MKNAKYDQIQRNSEHLVSVTWILTFPCVRYMDLDFTLLLFPVADFDAVVDETQSSSLDCW